MNHGISVQSLARSFGNGPGLGNQSMAGVSLTSTSPRLARAPAARLACVAVPGSETASRAGGAP